MNQENDVLSSNDFTTAKLPSSLNVLTILTFIGCALGLIFTLGTSAINKWLLGFMDKATNSGQEISSKDLAEIEKGRHAIELVQANLVPIMIVGVISVILCFTGALWMRKLKKDGFWIYLVGEVLPVISGFILIGTAQYTGVMSYVFGIGLPALFIILYAMQRKYLVK